MARFDGKVAAITGAGQSIGLATAKMFAQEGAKVILVGRTKSKIDAAVKEIGTDVAAGFCMDVGCEEEWVKFIAFIKENYGEIDFLVNNAAINKGKPILDESLEDFMEEIHCNMVSVFLGMKYCYEVLKKDACSAIVNVGSIASKKTGPVGANAAGYNATKAAVSMLTMHGAWNFAPDSIRVNSVLPAAVNTPLRTNYLDQHPEARALSAVSKPLPPHCTEPEHIAAAILFCCDSSCPVMTGAELMVDAGNSLY